jgi:hypothetical protein
MSWVASHEQNVLPFRTPRSYSLLGAKIKATDAAKNKERLDVCHNILRNRTIIVQ